MSDEVDNHDSAVLEAVCTKLKQHFDTVQVFVSRYEPGGETAGFSYGYGNLYARLGQTNEWLDDIVAGNLKAAEDGDDVGEI